MPRGRSASVMITNDFIQNAPTGRVRKKDLKTLGGEAPFITMFS